MNPDLFPGVPAGRGRCEKLDGHCISLLKDVKDYLQPTIRTRS